MAKLRISNEGLAFLRQWEGFRPTPYQCAAGQWTVGYGHVLRDGENYDTVSLSEAEALLRKDVAEVEAALSEALKGIELSQWQWDALVSFTFNIGIGNFKKSTLLKKLKQGDFKAAADEFLRWTKAKGKTVRGLVRRRKAERKLFLSNKGDQRNG